MLEQAQSIDLMEYERRYLLGLLNDKWAKLDAERVALPHHSDSHRQVLAEQVRIERLQEKIK